MEKSREAFRTISEVADWLDVPTHVLRFWESRFSQVKPVKRAGGRRYYRPTDMQLIGGIKKLLHEDGMTIRGVQKMLREQGVKHVATFSQPLENGADTTLDAVATPVPEKADGESPVISLVREAAHRAPETEEAEADAAPAQGTLSFESSRIHAVPSGDGGDDPLDDSPAHQRPAGLAAQLITRDKYGGVFERKALEQLVARLKDIRGAL